MPLSWLKNKATGCQSGARHLRKHQAKAWVAPHSESIWCWWCAVSLKITQTLCRFYKKTAKLFFVINALNKMLMYYSLLLPEPEVFGHICWFSKFSSKVKNRKKVHIQKLKHCTFKCSIACPLGGAFKFSYKKKKKNTFASSLRIPPKQCHSLGIQI